MRIRAVFGLVRPLNAVMMAAGVAVGHAMARAEGGAEWATLSLTILAAVALGAAGNAINDLYDVEIDRVNRPGRPLPSGALSTPAALAVVLVCIFFGLVAASVASVAHFLFAATVAGLLWLYSARLKRLPLIGNLAVALAVASTLVFGALPHTPGAAVWFAGVFASLTILAREIIKDIEDVVGDGLHDVRTLPLVAGPGFARLLAAAVALVTVCLTPLPYLQLGFSGAYLGLVLISDVFLLAAVWRVMGDGPGTAGAGTGSRLLKAAMITGLLALAVAAPTGSPL